MRSPGYGAALVLSFATSSSLCAQATGGITPPLSPRNANYSIDVRLDPASRTITASETITWRNITSKPVNDLDFHLYWNAWRDDRSSWQRERVLGRGTARDTRPGDRSSIEVSSLRLTGGSDSVDLTGSMRFIAPDDGNPEDRTVLQASLPQPAAPGSVLTIEVAWTAHVPRPVARTGAIGNFFFIAQWFPKLGVLEDSGWNCHQFHSSTEFFSDYGVYDVRMTVPKAWPVGATGVPRERRENSDGTVTHRYYQEDVHDFAWTTSPDALERTARFEHPTLPPVDIRLLLRPEHASQADRHFAAARAALKSYGEWFGAYPYGHLTIVDPAYQSGAGGMEYPTLITGGTGWLAAYSDDPEDVVVHETGHQFFYGIVGSNEFEDAWMDEGINTFAEARVMGSLETFYYTQRYFGGFVPFAFKDIRFDRETVWNRFAGYRRNPKLDRQSTPSYQYYPGANVTTYNKTALWLNTMERWLGWPAVQRTLSTFFTRWQFKHPKPQDFFDIASETAGRDLTPFFDQVYRSSDAFDYGIQELRSDRENGRYRTTLVVRRYGEAVFPVDVRVTFDNGEQVTEHWDGRDRWRQYVYDRDAKARSAEADPERVLLLDVNVTNNSRTLQPKGLRAATKWSLKWMVWLQDCLLSWSVFI
jgi:Peptidase family M1 domain